MTKIKPQTIIRTVLAEFDCECWDIYTVKTVSKGKLSINYKVVSCNIPADKVNAFKETLIKHIREQGYAKAPNLEVNCRQIVWRRTVRIELTELEELT